MLSSNDWTLLIRWGCFASVSHRALLGHAQCPTSKQPFLPLCGISHSHLLFQLHSQAQKPSTADRPRKAQGELQSSCWLRCAFALRTGGHTEGAGSAGRTPGAAQTGHMFAGPTDRHFSLPPLSSHKIRKETHFNDSSLKCAFPADLTLGRKSVYKINF